MTISNVNARVLVTRPAGQADRLVHVLADAGITASCLPLLNLEAIDTVEQLAQIKKQLQQIHQQHFAIFISSNAVKYTAEFMQQYHLTWPITLPCIPIGGATAKAIQNLNWPLDENINSNISDNLSAYSSEKLLQQLSQRDVSGMHITIFRGEGGRELLAQDLTARGATVEYCEMYKRQHPSYSADEFSRAVGVDKKPAAILFASGETLENFYRHMQRDKLQRQLEAVPIIVPSERIKLLAEGYGFKKIFLAVNASAEGFLHVLEQKVLAQ